MGRFMDVLWYDLSVRFIYSFVISERASGLGRAYIGHFQRNFMHFVFSMRRE